MVNSKHKWLATTGILLGIVVLALDWSIVNTAIPSIQRDLHATLSEMQWVMNLFGLCMTPLLVLMGRLSDAYGRKKLFVIGLVIFGVASLFAGLAMNPLWLITCRGFQGVGAAILLPGSQALISHVFPPEERKKAIGLWMTVVGLGLALGPALGGIITSAFSWQYIFFINVPFILVCLFIVVKFVQETKQEHGHTSIDWSGITLLFLSLACIVFATIEGPNSGFSSPMILFFYSMGLILSICFVIVERNKTEPVIDFALFGNRRFLAGSISNFCCIAFIWGTFFLASIYLQNLRNFNSLHAGAILLAMTIPFMIVSSLISHFHKIVKPKRFILMGFILLIFSALIQVQFDMQTEVSMIILALLFFGVGWGLMFGPSTTAALDSIPRDLAGIASGGVTTIQEMGGTLGLAITGSIFHAVELKKLPSLLESASLQISPSKLTLLKSQMSDIAVFTAEAGKLGIEENITSFFNESFVSGYQAALYFPLALSIFGFIFVFFVMPSRKAAQR